MGGEKEPSISMSKLVLKTKSSSLIPSTYAPLLADLKARGRAAQVKAAVAVNRELILLYWHIRLEILRAQKAEDGLRCSH